MTIATLRVATGVESTITQPQSVIRRDQDRICVALNQEFADYSSQLEVVTDQLADGHPLVPSVRAIQGLYKFTLPIGVKADKRR